MARSCSRQGDSFTREDTILSHGRRQLSLIGLAFRVEGGSLTESRKESRNGRINCKLLTFFSKVWAMGSTLFMLMRSGIDRPD